MGMRFAAMFRIKNEGKWIRRVIESVLPLCERIYVMDDHSTDNTLQQCMLIETDRLNVLESPFENLDEARDKNWLYDWIIQEYETREGRYCWPDWLLCIDGDEELAPGGTEIIRQTCGKTDKDALSLRIIYLWNTPNQVRVDGVYGDFRRPSMFRVINPAFRFQTTPWNGNLHCSSIPQELIHGFGKCEAKLLHYGYMDAGRRMMKWNWYNTIDPGNEAEDCYLHMIIGDHPGLPASSRRKWAGPLRLEPLR
jgi:glycosyltransferase involved in cell wall biosynthesis